MRCLQLTGCGEAVVSPNTLMFHAGRGCSGARALVSAEWWGRILGILASSIPVRCEVATGRKNRDPGYRSTADRSDSTLHTLNLTGGSNSLPLRRARRRRNVDRTADQLRFPERQEKLMTRETLKIELNGMLLFLVFRYSDSSTTRCKEGSIDVLSTPCEQCGMNVL
ncbi:hypothetical protein BJ508DRAFT_154555 [Ascobolus immersus RN42]|uniref:Uncharacterized protein n=1 Tax=Ascobolus immersus RN42 TaxID=1160509 RepID=A0A3N4HXM3_ASCIM|nr:hypothetical protein BJ508DRAFT_154555 [Ascobolus immersus RN42]